MTRFNKRIGWISKEDERKYKENIGLYGFME